MDDSDVGRVLRSARRVVEQMSNACNGVRFARSRCKAVIYRANRLIEEVQQNTQRNGLGAPLSQFTEFQEKLVDVQTILQKLSDMSFLKALLYSDLISRELEMAHHILSDCLVIFHIGLSFHAQEEQNNARIADQAYLRNVMKEIKGDYLKIRNHFGIKSDEEEDQAMVAMEKTLRQTTSRDVVETQIIKSSLECIKSSTGKRSPELKRWLITDYELDYCGDIGGGGFSTVRKAKFRGTTVAVKVLKNVEDSKSLEKEVNIWRELRNDYIVPFYGACTSTSNPYIVCRYMRNGNIPQYLCRHPNVDHTKLLFEISLGMVYLHGERIVHGDLKGLNILVDDAGKACITDFGLSCIETPVSVGARMNKVPGTLRYLAPEALKGQPLNFETDVYAFGMVIYEVYAGECPFIDVPDEEVRNGHLSIQRPRTREVSVRGLNDDMWRLLLETSSHDPAARPSFDVIRRRIMSTGQGIDTQTFQPAYGESSWDERQKTYGYSSSRSRALDSGENQSPRNSLSQEKAKYLSNSSLISEFNSEKPMCAEVTCKYFNVEFGLVKSREPGVYLEENETFKWQPVSAKKGTLLRAETNRFTYRRTTGEATNSWELNGNNVLLQTAAVNAECCFRDDWAAKKWFGLQLSYSRDGSVSVWGPSSLKATGDWITKTRSWRRLASGKLQTAPLIDGAPNLTPSSWSQVDIPKRYVIDNSGGDSNTLTCIVNPGSSRPSKFRWNVQGKAVIFTMNRFNDQTPTMMREEVYSLESEARIVFTAMKIVLEKGSKKKT